MRLWRKLGFEMVGTIPEALHRLEQGLVGAQVMFKKLEQKDE